MPEEHGVLEIIYVITDLCYRHANELRLNEKKRTEQLPLHSLLLSKNLRL